MNTPITPGVNLLEPTFERAASVWWAIFWRAALLGGGGGFVIGLIAGIAGQMANIPQANMRSVILVLGVAVGIPAGIFAVQLVLRKTFREFTIRLVPREPEMPR
jgi:hypothetical protein